MGHRFWGSEVQECQGTHLYWSHTALEGGCQALIEAPPHGLYVVHMKQVTASAARQHWFRLLDEVAEGETVVVERRGRRIVLQRETKARKPEIVPDYSGVIRSTAVDDADRWGWAWKSDRLKPVVR